MTHWTYVLFMCYIVGGLPNTDSSVLLAYSTLDVCSANECCSLELLTVALLHLGHNLMSCDKRFC